MTRKKKSRHIKNNLLLENLEYHGSYAVETVVELISYDGEHLTRKHIDSAAGIASLIDAQQVNWIHVCGLSNTALIGSLCETLGIERLLVQDILNAEHIAKIEETNGHLLAVIDVFDYDKNQTLTREHLSLVLGKNFVLSFQESAENHFEMINRALDEKFGQVRCRQADFLFNLLVSSVIDRYIEVLEIHQNMMLELEDRLMEFKAVTANAGRQIQDYRRDYMLMKKSIFPIREQFAHLLVSDSALIAKNTHIYLKDSYDHLQQACMMVESSRETISSLFGLYLSSNDLRMNRIMKQLTVVATVFIPLTFLVGLWGMNFRFMPELEWKYGYLAAWCVMIAVGSLLYFYFKRKKWN